MNNRFLQLKEKVNADLYRIYDEIHEKLCRIDCKNVPGTLVWMETEKVNVYVAEFTAKVRPECMEAMKEQGYPEYMTEGAWRKIMKEVGVPTIKLCSIQEIPESQPYHFQSANEKKMDGKQERMKELHDRKKKGIGAAGLGGAAVAAALVIPGWNSVPLMLMGAGTVVLIGGSVSAISAHREMETLKSKLEKEKMRSGEHNTADKQFLKQLTDSQAQCNITVMENWLDQVESAMKKICDGRKN